MLQHAIKSEKIRRKRYTIIRYRYVFATYTEQRRNVLLYTTVLIYALLHVFSFPTVLILPIYVNGNTVKKGTQTFLLG